MSAVAGHRSYSHSYACSAGRSGSGGRASTNKLKLAVLRLDYRRLLDGLSTSVLVIDQHLRLRYINQAAEVLLGSSLRQSEGAPLADLVRGDGLLNALRRCLHDDSRYIEHELRLRLTDGRELIVEAAVSAQANADDQSANNDGNSADNGERFLLAELRPIDQQQRFSRERRLLAQHNTAKLLARNLAHEIKNPLGGLRGAAQLLQAELPDPEQREYTQVIIGEADRLSNLVERMLGPNRPLTLRPLNIHELLERVRGLTLAESPWLQIEPDYDPSIPSLNGDAEQLIQALLNLTRNAARALQDQHGAEVRLRTRVQRQGTIGLRRHRLVLQLDVIDNGPGVSAALQEDMFLPTISGYADGTGLGLPIAQQIVSLHNGLIECRSRHGETVFSLLLPLETAHE